MKNSGSNWEVIFGGLFLFLTHKYQDSLGKLVVEFLKQNSLTFGATFGVNLCLFLDCFWCICYALKQGTVLHNLWMLWHNFEYFILICNCWKYWFFGWIKFGANFNCTWCSCYQSCKSVGFKFEPLETYLVAHCFEWFLHYLEQFSHTFENSNFWKIWSLLAGTIG